MHAVFTKSMPAGHRTRVNVFNEKKNPLSTAPDYTQIQVPLLTSPVLAFRLPAPHIGADPVPK